MSQPKKHGCRKCECGEANGWAAVNRAASRRQTLRRPNIISMRLRRFFRSPVKAGRLQKLNRLAELLNCAKKQEFRLMPQSDFTGSNRPETKSLCIVDQTILPNACGNCGSSTCNDFRQMISGRDLLRAQCSGDRDRPTLALNLSNPFPALVGSPSPRHAPIWLHEGRSFSQTTHVPAADLFGDDGGVMVARGDPNADGLLKIYASHLRRQFTLRSENSDCQLWTRPGQ